MKWRMIILAALAVLVSGCGGSGEQPVGETQAPAADWSELRQLAGTVNAEHQLVIPSGDPPEKVTIEKLHPGHGKALAPDDEIVLRYKAFDYTSGSVTQDRWQKEGFQAWYTSELVDGWETGLRGMREGEWRELVVPGHLAYGGDGLVYLIEMERIGT